MLERSEINISCKPRNPSKAEPSADANGQRAFERILVAIDDSEPAKAAVETAQSIAFKTGASLRLVYVVDTTRNWNPESPASAELSYEFLRSEGEWLLRRAQKHLARSIPSTWELLVGPPPATIVADAEQWNADLIVIGTHGRGRLGTFLLGSTAQAVVATAGCPGLVVGPHTLNRVKAFLTDQHVNFTTLPHKIEFTAARTADRMRIPAGQFAKTLLVKLDGQYALAVVGANRRLDLELLRRSAGADEVKLATEQEVEAFFPRCEVGAMPPLGHLYGLDVYVDLPLSHQEQIVFNSGTHDEAIAMPYQEFEKLSRVQVVQIGKPREKPVLSGALQI